MEPKIGLQLYSVGQQMQEDAYGTLQKVDGENVAGCGFDAHQ